MQHLTLCYHPARLRILLDYRPALRQRTGVGEYAHHLATALVPRLGAADTVTLFSSSWKDRLRPDAVAGAAALDLRIPVRVLNLLWHRLEWPSVEWLGAAADVTWSLHPLLMPSTRAAQVITVHDLHFLDRPEATTAEVRRDYPALVRAHARRADGVIVNSEYTRSLVLNRLQVPEDRVTVCYPGAPAWPLRPEPAAPGPILHVGTIEPRKNVSALIRAYLALARRRPEVPPLVFAGRLVEPATSGVPEEDRELFARRVSFLGYVADERRSELYREASLLVVASSDEGFGLPALEAMTVGLPVVAAARGSLPEVLGDAGLLVDPDDRDQFAAAIEKVLSDTALRRRMTVAGLVQRRRFDWQASAAALLGAFRAAVARRGQRR